MNLDGQPNRGPGAMSPYEREQWQDLNKYWERKSSRRGMPKAVASSGRAVSRAAGGAAAAAGRVVPGPVKAAATSVGDTIADHALQPALKGAVGLIELVDAWATDLIDPASVVKLARARGVDIGDFSELSGRDLRDCDRLVARDTLKWRTAGALEGAGMGAVALIPVAGLPLSVTADVVILQILSVSIATRIAYSYGIDGASPAESDFITELATGALARQATKIVPLRDAGRAHQAAAKRVRWSPKLRDDHVLVAKLEQFMAKWYTGGKVPVQHMSKALSVFAIVVGAGVNATTLGRVSSHAQRYCRTRFLAEKYGLELPAALRKGDVAEDLGHDF
ncbi:EcsC family protein [Aquipuribacter hungaricus]|uniref:EcsC family protein n=1 Tax=Aquipuribacter hungaricus TaxID=545624 RepID=A0ABV7WFP9_9MICO